MSNNFIGIYENVVPDSLCDELIEFFESCDKLGLTKSRQQQENVSKLDKNDDMLFFSSALNLLNYPNGNPLANLFWTNVYAKYAEDYPVLPALAPQGVYEYKLQRTQIGGGYHIWHSEQGNKITSSRILTFTCYLNDVAEGGETEFLYYPKRVPPKKGTFLLFPGGFTHAHRGNPPISNTKYIVTGWVEFAA